MASVAQIGGFTFSDNELNLVTIDRLSQYSPRRKRLNQIVTAHCFGEAIAATSDLIIARIASIENALTNDNQDFRYTVNGTLAQSLLNNSACISGVKVVHRSFPKGDGAELATKRSFAFSLQATYDAADDDLVSWTESIQTVGNGGPKFYVVDTVLGPASIYTSQTSAVYYLQSGSAVGYRNYPTPPAACVPAGLFNDRPRIGHISGRNIGSQIRFYTTTWSYYMGRDVSVFGSTDPLPISQ